jgi:spore coat polysaccharide biosynthesis protein SpsF
MTAVVVQARLGSTRLPGKALLPLGGQPLIHRVLSALRAVRADAYALACPPSCAAAFAPSAEQNGFTLITGPEDDVLTRYCNAIRTLHADRVIRATGDNPFVFADAANALLAETLAAEADYAAYASLPYGAGVESVAACALLRAEREAALPAEREHVCPYLYTHGDRFHLHRPLAPRRWRHPEIRLTVDTPDDYRHAQRLWHKLTECDNDLYYYNTKGEATSCSHPKGEVSPTLQTCRADSGVLPNNAPERRDTTRQFFRYPLCGAFPATPPTTGVEPETPCRWPITGEAIIAAAEAL